MISSLRGKLIYSDNQYAVIELLEVEGTHFIKRSTTMSKRELRKMLGISNREGVEII